MLLKNIQVVVLSHLFRIVMRAFLILSLIALSTSIDTRSCLSPRCTSEFSPVCAVDGWRVEHPFWNRCYFENDDCRRKEAGLPPWKMIAGKCQNPRRIVKN
ncbi:uncharacterized protein LOC108164268 [Drosophila miranda]|uniref:uncharacterized protein LOC108164268 n=1 Tax=Drosophila miranda TaxID=7229 RepID=UPI0007E5E0CC|nr:uncharacterized protein LOC108164268 [Drosophila miranda]